MAPRVPMSTSVYWHRGAMVTSMRSSPAVEPMMYPWSKASITVLPLLGSKMRERRFLAPQSPWPRPLAKKPCSGAGTSRW